MSRPRNIFNIDGTMTDLCGALVLAAGIVAAVLNLILPQEIEEEAENSIEDEQSEKDADLEVQKAGDQK